MDYPKIGSTIRATKDFKDKNGRNIVEGDEFTVDFIMKKYNYMIVKSKNGDEYKIRSINLDGIVTK